MHLTLSSLVGITSQSPSGPPRLFLHKRPELWTHHVPAWRFWADLWKNDPAEKPLSLLEFLRFIQPLQYLRMGDPVAPWSLWHDTKKSPSDWRQWSFVPSDMMPTNAKLSHLQHIPVSQKITCRHHGTMLCWQHNLSSWDTFMLSGQRKRPFNSSLWLPALLLVGQRSSQRGQASGNPSWCRPSLPRAGTHPTQPSGRCLWQWCWTPPLH